MYNLKLLLNKSESTQEPNNHGRFSSQYQLEIITSIRQLVLHIGLWQGHQSGISWAVCKQLEATHMGLQPETHRHCQIIYTQAPTAVTVSLRYMIKQSRGLESASELPAGAQASCGSQRPSVEDFSSRKT